MVNCIPMNICIVVHCIPKHWYRGALYTKPLVSWCIVYQSIGIVVHCIPKHWYCGALYTKSLVSWFIVYQIIGIMVHCKPFTGCNGHISFNTYTLTWMAWWCVDSEERNINYKIVSIGISYIKINIKKWNMGCTSRIFLWSGVTLCRAWTTNQPHLFSSMSVPILPMTSGSP